MIDEIWKTILHMNRFNIFELYANEKYFSEVLFAYKNKDSSDSHLADYANMFIDTSLLLLINKPSDLLTCIKGVSKRQQSIFLDFLLRHKNMNGNVCAFLGNDIDSVRQLKHDDYCGWLGRYP